MTNEKAIKLLREMQEAWKLQITGDAFDALEMAITALENNSNDEVNNSTNNSTNEIENRVTGMTACRVPEVAKDTNVLNNDTISRQAAIDALDTGLWGVEWDKALATAMLKDLPSVQPEIIRCRDCKWSDISAMGHLAVCNHARGLINASPNSYCNFAERRTDERTD